MDITLAPSLSLKPGHVLVVFVGSKKSTKKDDRPQIVHAPFDAEVKAIIDAAVESKGITGNAKEVVLFRNSINDKKNHLAVVGLGDAENFTHEVFRNAAADAVKACQAAKAQKAHVLWSSVNQFTQDDLECSRALAEAATLVSYSYNDLKSGKDKKKDKDPGLSIEVVAGKSASIKDGIQFGSTLAEYINFAKWLGDTPGNYMTPKRLAEEVAKKAKGTGLKVTSWNKERIKKEKFGGLLGVSLGSDAEPRFILMEYKGAGPGQKPIAFVGKGLTFDSGGISIKPAAAMDEMKFDMCGGANVIATMLALAKLKIKVNAIGFVPSTENMPGPLATKPGDVLTARNGKTVEVLNTDAEGRLILMDALAYASEQKPQMIVDAATLTGAIVVALSNIHTGVFTKDEKLAAKIQAAANDAGELIWRMPIHDEHLKEMKGTYADLQNIGKKSGAGSATAAAFLSQFVDEDIPWAHFDIAGTAWNCADRLSYCPPKGATGVMVRTFVELAKSFAKSR